MRVLRALVCSSTLGIGLAVGGMSLASASTVARSTQCGDVGCAAPGNSAKPQSGVQVSATTQAPTPSSTTAGGSLAFTGADIAETTLLAFAAIGIGSTMVYSSRKTRRSTSAIS